MSAHAPARGSDRDGRARWWPNPATAGAAYVTAWAFGFTVHRGVPELDAAPAAVAEHYATHGAEALAGTLLTDGVAALTLLPIVIGVARMVRHRTGHRLRAVILGGGYVAVWVSLVQMALEIIQSLSADVDRPGRADAVFDAVHRLEGVTQLSMATFVVAATLAAGRLFAWSLVLTGLALAAALAVAGSGYLLLWAEPARMAEFALVLSLVWVPATGFVIQRKEPT